jgi:hypothetical protein
MAENLPKIQNVTAALQMQPTSQSPNELRFRSKGSLSLNTLDHTWFDHEAGTGGGVFALVEHLGKANSPAEAAAWCKEHGILTNETSGAPLYHETKGIKLHGARIEGKAVVVSMRYADGQHAGEQSIWPNSNKKFTKSMKTKGAHAVLGGNVGGVTYLCEGWATAASATEATDRPAVFCGSAKNLPIVAAALQEKYPDAEFIVAADHDKAGIDAAEATGLPWTVPSQVGHDWNDVHQALGLEAVAGEIQGNVVQPSAKPKQCQGAMKLLTAKQLNSLELPDLSYIIQDILPDVGLTLSAGPPKVGKTWLNWWIAKQAVQAGKRVLFISTEDNNRRMRDRLQQTFHEPPDNLICLAIMSQEAVLPTGPSALIYMQELVDEYSPDLLIVDTVGGILTPSASNKNYDITVSEYGALRKFSHKNALALIGTTHTRKKSEVSSAPVETILGSQGIGATAETLLVMEKLEGQKNCRLHVTGKDVPQDDFFLRWTGNGFDLEANTEEAELGPFQKDCLEQIRRKPRITQLGLIHDLGKDQAQVSRAVNRLIEKDLIIKIKEGYTAI